MREQTGDGRPHHARADDGHVERLVPPAHRCSVDSATWRQVAMRCSASSALTAGSTTATGCHGGSASAGSLLSPSPRRAKAATPSAVAWETDRPRPAPAADRPGPGGASGIGSSRRRPAGARAGDRGPSRRPGRAKPPGPRCPRWRPGRGGSAAVAKESPVNAPRAWAAQKGAPSPARPGTKAAPPASGTAPPNRSRSAGSVMTPIASSQDTAAPTVNTWPSRHHVGWPPSRQATQPTSPVPDRTGCEPTVARRKAPVP